MSARRACANGHVHGSTAISTASSGAISIASGDLAINEFLAFGGPFRDPFSATGAKRKNFPASGECRLDVRGRRDRLGAIEGTYFRYVLLRGHNRNCTKVDAEDPIVE
jgi:hypothetical protein